MAFPSHYIAEPPMIILSLMTAGTIEATLHAGDGGNIRFSNLICDVSIKGGEGATVNVTFEVGNGANSNSSRLQA